MPFIPPTAVAFSALHETFVSQASAAELNALVAESLNPNVLNVVAWSDLLSLIEPREEEIASDTEHLGDDTGALKWKTELSSAKIARIETLSSICSLEGEAGRIAAIRFEETFGSDRWIAWSSVRELSLIPEIVKNQRRFSNPMLLPLLREWLVDEFIERNDSKHGSLALTECIRLGVFNRVVRGEILENVLRQRARPKGASWEYEAIAFLDAMLLQDDVQDIAGDASSATVGPKPRPWVARRL